MVIAPDLFRFHTFNIYYLSHNGGTKDGLSIIGGKREFKGSAMLILSFMSVYTYLF